MRVRIVLLALLAASLTVVAVAQIMRLRESTQVEFVCPTGYQYNPADGMCWPQAERMEQR